MAKILLAALLGVTLVPYVQAGQAGSSKQAPRPKIQEGSDGFVSPSEFNVYIEPDPRTLIVMAAVSVVSSDHQVDASRSPARAQIKKDLANMDPDLKGRLAAFFQSKRRAGVDESGDALRYEALSLLMTPPPLFSIHPELSTLPEDLQPLVGFVPLLQEFYQK